MGDELNVLDLIALTLGFLAIGLGITAVIEAWL